MANFIKPKVYTIDEYNEIKKLFDPIKTLTETRKVEIAGRTCFSDDTELLTENGWKNVQIINENEKVLTYNNDKNILEYQKSNMFNKKYDGQMINVDHLSASFSVTPDHSIYATKPHTKER